jgi:hypothetical protein
MAERVKFWSLAVSSAISKTPCLVILGRLEGVTQDLPPRITKTAEIRWVSHRTVRGMTRVRGLMNRPFANAAVLRLVFAWLADLGRFRSVRWRTGAWTSFPVIHSPIVNQWDG